MAREEYYLETQENLPTFLAVHCVAVTETERRRLVKYMDNWLTIHSYIKTLEPVIRDVRKVAMMLALELSNDNRLHIVHRLRARFNALRIAHEDRELHKLFTK